MPLADHTAYDRLKGRMLTNLWLTCAVFSASDGAGGLESSGAERSRSPLTVGSWAASGMLRDLRLTSCRYTASMSPTRNLHTRAPVDVVIVFQWPRNATSLLSSVWAVGTGALKMQEWKSRER